jgi:hypothetical protein
MNEITSTTTASSVALTTGNETAPSGFRLIGITWKSTKDKAGVVTPARASVSVCVPKLPAVLVEPECLSVAITAMLADLQYECVRAQVEDGAEVIVHDSVAFPALAEFHAATATSKKLSGALIGAWFDAHIQSPLMAALTNALNITEVNDVSTTKLIQATAIFRKGFVELATPRPVLPPSDVQNITKALSFITEPDEMHSVLSAKVALLANPKRAEMVNINI